MLTNKINYIVVTSKTYINLAVVPFVCILIVVDKSSIHCDMVKGTKYAILLLPRFATDSRDEDEDEDEEDEDAEEDSE